MAHGCAVCCTVFSGICIVLLVMFGFMFKYRNISLAIRAHMAHPVWDLDDKAMSCFIAAGIYGFFFVVSVIFVLRNPSPESETGMIDQNMSQFSPLCEGGSVVINELSPLMMNELSPKETSSKPKPSKNK